MVGAPLLVGRFEPADSLPFMAFLVVLAVAETVRSDGRLRKAGRDWHHRVMAGVATVAASLAGLAVGYLAWTTIGPDREAAPVALAYRAVEGVIGTLNAQLMLVGILLALAIWGYRRMKALERQDRLSG